MLTSDVDKALDGLHEDGKAKCEQKDAVDECSENFCPLPSVGVPGVIRALLLAQLRGAKKNVTGVSMLQNLPSEPSLRYTHLESIQCNDEGHDIVEHVEGVSDQCQGAGSIPF